MQVKNIGGICEFTGDVLNMLILSVKSYSDFSLLPREAAG